MINLIKVKENSDGTAEYSFDYDDAFIAYYKKETGAKIVRKSNVGKFILKLITQIDSNSTPKKS